MGSGSQVFNQISLSRTKASCLHSDIYQLRQPRTTNLQSTVEICCLILQRACTCMMWNIGASAACEQYHYSSRCKTTPTYLTRPFLLSALAPPDHPVFREDVSRFLYPSQRAIRGTLSVKLSTILLLCTAYLLVYKLHLNISLIICTVYNLVLWYSQCKTQPW